MLDLSIAVRFLRASLVQSILIAVGIAIGIGVQVFLGSLIMGLQEDLIDQTIGHRSQVTVLPGEGAESLRYTDAVKSAIAAEKEIVTQVPVREFSAILKVGETTRPLRFTGGSVNELEPIYALGQRAVSGTPSLTGHEIVLGKDLADELQLSPGDTVTLVLPDGTDFKVTMTAVVDLGSAAANSAVGFASATMGAGALDLEDDEYTAVETQVDKVFDSVAIAENLAADDALADLTVTEWQSENQDLLAALQAQSSSSYTIQFFVLLAVALGIASTLAISAAQKTRQIGILKAMGMRDRQAGRIFLWQAAILGLAGAGAGVLVGVILIVGFSSQSADFSFAPKVGFTALSFVIGVGVALLSSLIPSRRTSRVDPIEVIQGG